MMYPQNTSQVPTNLEYGHSFNMHYTDCPLQIMCDLEQDSNSNTTAHVKSRENVISHIDLKQNNK